MASETRVMNYIFQPYYLVVVIYIPLTQLPKATHDFKNTVKLLTEIIFLM